MKGKMKFSLMEAFIVIAIVLIVAPIVRPKVLSATVPAVRGIFQRVAR